MDLGKIGEESLLSFTLAIKKVIQKHPFDLLAGAGESGQIAVYIAGEVYRQLGLIKPQTLVAPIYRHANEEETILFDNRTLHKRYKLNFKFSKVLFIDDEIGSGLAAFGMLDLLIAINPEVSHFTILAEDGGFDCPKKYNGVRCEFFPSKKRISKIYNAISYNIPAHFLNPVNNLFIGLPDYNNKQAMCTLLDLPVKKFNSGNPEFTNTLLEMARKEIPDFVVLQQKYQKYLNRLIEDTFRGNLVTRTSY